MNEDHWPINHLATLATWKIRVVFQIYTAEWLLNPSCVYVGQSPLKQMQFLNPLFLYGNVLGTWGQKWLWLVNSQIYTSQRHRNHPELCKGNSIRPMIISCLKKLRHYIKREILPASFSSPYGVFFLQAKNLPPHYQQLLLPKGDTW